MTLSPSLAALVLSPSTLTLVALVAIGLAIVAVLYSIANAGKARGFRRRARPTR